MPGVEQTYERIIAYLKGLLSARQRHDLEKDMMRDAFDEDAFEGLSQLSAQELEADMNILNHRLENRTRTSKERNRNFYFRLAAGILIIVGLGSALYFLLRKPSQDLLSEKKEISVTEAKKMPSPVFADSGKRELHSERKSEAGKQENPAVLADNRTETTIPESSRQQEKIAKSIQNKRPPLKIFSAKVVDIEGNALTGVSVTEKGRNSGTETDSRGWFSLPLSDTGSVLVLRAAGLKPVEFNTGENPGENITMQNDLISMDEVVVVAYGNQGIDKIRPAAPKMKKNEVRDAAPSAQKELQGKVAGVSVSQKSATVADSITPDELHEAYLMVKPIPPGGTLNDFKKWVTDRIDSAVFEAYTGIQAIRVSFTVQENGSIRDISIRGKVPFAIAEEFKRIIAQSPLWKPALRNNSPVEALVTIRFTIR